MRQIIFSRNERTGAPTSPNAKLHRLCTHMPRKYTCAAKHTTINGKHSPERATSQPQSYWLEWLGRYLLICTNINRNNSYNFHTKKQTSKYFLHSILAPLLFSLYMLPLSQIMRKNQIAYHSYADDTQIYLALSPNDYSPIDSLCQCIDEINSWMCQNFLQLNKEKTEVIAFGNKDEVLKVNAYLDSRGQTTKNQVRNLGVILETDL